MHQIDILRSVTGKSLGLSVLILLAAGTPGYALRMTKMSKDVQTTNTEPQVRTITLRLPLRQPEFHWTFMSREELLAGRLVLRIMRAGGTNQIMIFEGGQIGEGWEPMPFNNPKAGEIYFGFKSSKKYATAPSDQLELELQVKHDLKGIGPLETGILPAGIYRARGTYSGLVDEYKPASQIANMPKETLAKLRAAYEFTAFLENWQDQWDLRPTGQDGWLPPEQRQSVQKMLEKLRQQDEAARKK